MFYLNKKYNGYSLLDLMIVIITSGVVIYLVLQLYSKCLKKAYIHKNNYNKINELIMLDNVMNKFVTNVNFSPCMRLTDLGIRLDNLISIINNGSKLIINTMDNDVMFIEILDNKIGVIKNKCLFSKEDYVILVGCNSLNINKIIDVISYQDRCKLFFENSIKNANLTYISKWHKIIFSIENDLIYLDTGHKELWLSQLHKPKFSFDQDQYILSIDFFMNNRKKRVSWRLN